MQQVNIDELEKLERAATAGPWKALDERYFQDYDGWSVGETYEGKDCAKFIVAIRNALPAILHELRVRREADKMMREMNFENMASAMKDEKTWLMCNDTWSDARNEIIEYIDKELGSEQG